MPASHATVAIRGGIVRGGATTAHRAGRAPPPGTVKTWGFSVSCAVLRHPLADRLIPGTPPPHIALVHGVISRAWGNPPPRDTPCSPRWSTHGFPGGVCRVPHRRSAWRAAAPTSPFRARAVGSIVRSRSAGVLPGRARSRVADRAHSACRPPRLRARPPPHDPPRLPVPRHLRFAPRPPPPAAAPPPAPTFAASGGDLTMALPWRSRADLVMRGMPRASPSWGTLAFIGFILPRRPALPMSSARHPCPAAPGDRCRDPRSVAPPQAPASVRLAHLPPTPGHSANATHAIVRDVAYETVPHPGCAPTPPPEQTNHVLCQCSVRPSRGWRHDACPRRGSPPRHTVRSLPGVISLAWGNRSTMKIFPGPLTAAARPSPCG